MRRLLKISMVVILPMLVSLSMGEVYAFDPIVSEKALPDQTPESSTVYESLKYYSEILGRDVSYSVYLPKDYEGSTMNFPVLYLLHGYSDDETGWIQFGQIQRIADRAIQNDEAAQMIVIMPDAEVTWYVNSADGNEAYEDFFIKELIPHVDKEFRTRTDRQFRAVAGLSMGGYGALVMGLRHPELFSSSGALSAGVFTDDEILEMEQNRWNSSLGLPFGMDLSGEARLKGNYRQYAPQQMIDDYKEKNKTTRFYIDCGDDDFLILGNLALHAQMIKAEIPHEFRVRDGGHSWTYWRTALPEVFSFISEVFHR